MQVLDIIMWGCILAGCFFTVSSGIGMLRFPDFFTRIHAASIGDALGIPLILLGLAIKVGFSLVALKIGILAFFLFITSPTATHALTKAAYSSGIKPLGDNKS